MSIKKMGARGIYWCSFYPAPGAPRVRQSLHTSDKAEAQRAEARLKLEYEEKAKRVGEGITLGEAFKHAMRVRDSWRSAKRVDEIHQIYSLVVSYFGENATLSSLTDEAVIKYGEYLFDRGLAGGTINTRLSLINVMFESAIKYKKFDGRKPVFERYKVGANRRRLVTPQEEALMVSLLQAHGTQAADAMADLVMVLGDTGMRLSEGLGVVPDNINKEASVVLIRQTKNGEDRIIPLTERALGILIKRAHASPMFHTLTVNAADALWTKMRKKMGLADENEFVIHALRHTFASTLANAGVDAFRIQKVMGHKTITTTQKYVKVSSASLTGLSDIMAKRTVEVSPKVSPKGVQKTTLGDLLSLGKSGISASYTESRDQTGMASMSFMGRIGKPQDIAGVVLFLVSDDAGWVTGQNISASGGLA